MIAPRYPRFVLASTSPIRRQILESAGLAHEAVSPRVEEPRPQTGETARTYVLRAARAKALAVSGDRPGEIVVGCDQVVEFEETILTKVEDRTAARERLQQLSGRVHRLVNGLVLVRDRQVNVEHVETVTVTLRDLSDEFIEAYLEAEAPLSSVACYFLEGRGLQLIRSLDGPFHSALGLPVLALLDRLLETPGRS